METNIIAEKLFRLKENMKKVRFILANTDITFDTIIKAAIIARKNDFHNFGHQLGAAEQAIRIAQAENRTKAEINLVALTMLIHDAGHKGIVKVYDEMRAFELANEILLPSDTGVISENHGIVMQNIRDLVLCTIFPNARGKNNNPLMKIIQDADLAHLGLGPIYWVWASMGLIEEFNRTRTVPLTPISFIRDEQEKFVKFLLTLSGTGKVYLSEGAQMIFRDPVESVQVIKNWPEEAIEFAYKVRKDDITVEEFEKEISKYFVN